MGTWVSILVAFAAGIWGTIRPKEELKFFFGRHYEKRKSSPSSGAKLLMRTVSILTLGSAVYLAVHEITLIFS